jgi:hypothetical protein
LRLIGGGGTPNLVDATSGGRVALDDDGDTRWPV